MFLEGASNGCHLLASLPMRLWPEKWYVAMLPLWLDVQEAQALFVAFACFCCRHPKEIVLQESLFGVHSVICRYSLKGWTCRKVATFACVWCRLPKEIVLQQGHSPRAARPPKASTVARFTTALKRAGRRFRTDIARRRAMAATAAARGAAGRLGKKATDAMKVEGHQPSGALGLADPDSAPTLLADQPPPQQQPTGARSIR